MVLNFVYALLSANFAQQSLFYAKQIPRGVFKENQNVIAWIYDYHDKHQRYPTLSVFQSRFPNVELRRTKDIVDTALQAVLDNDVYDQINSAVENAKSLYSKGRGISDVLGALRKDLNDARTYDMQYIDLNVGKSESSLKRYRTRVRQALSGHVSHAPSPWPTYNELVGFCDYGESNLIAARTSLGKSWALIAWADHYRRLGERVLVVSKEMPAEQLGDRFEALQYKLNYPKFRKGRLSPKELGRWVREKQARKFDNLIISGQETITGVGFEHIIGKIQQYSPTVMFVDGAYLIKPAGLSKQADDVAVLGEISGMMKRIAMTFKLICFSVVQGNRQGEDKAGNAKTSLKDIYGSDRWAQDADNVILLGGKRGGTTRTVNLAKGRESNIGEFVIEFQLDPYPSFNERASLNNVKEGQVEFATI